ncbi:MAG TPA: hypothetical protein VD907_07125 [Verrucomicrobiae bacterium]|nr:hypothetical protein [Verrucomicrobiae bacterium]
MSNNKTNQAEPSKPAKKYAKTKGEHFKDIVIAVLVASIVAFVAGMYFANQHQADIDKAVSAVAPKAEAAPTVK